MPSSNCQFSTSSISYETDLNNVVEVQTEIDVKQINMHHARGATDLMVNSLHMAQTNKKHLIILAQEPYFINNEIQGFDKQLCTVFQFSNGNKVRSCIVASSNMSVTLLPQYCDGDTSSVLLNTGPNGRNEEIVLCSAYLPYDALESRPGKMVSEITNYCESTGRPLILGCDANAHHTLWGSSDINKRGEELIEFVATTNLEILNKGREPTFVTRNRSEVLDVTLATRDIIHRVVD